MSNPPSPGWQPPIPTGGWPTWSVRKRILLVVSLAVLVGVGLLGYRIYDDRNPDFTIAVIGCSADNRTATVELAITNEMSRKQDARLTMSYRNQSGKRLGEDTIDVPGIRSGETIRKTQTTELDASSASLTCEAGEVFAHDALAD